MKNYQVNDLVRHKNLTSLGIGCVSKVLKNSYKVNFGTQDCFTTTEKMLIPVDTSKCKTISFSEFRVKTIANSWKGGEVRVIIGNEVKEYVGIGWISKGVVTESDLTKYKSVI